MSIKRDKRAVDAAGMRARNRSLVLDLIWRHREISRTDLAQITGLSPSTISLIVRSLADAGLVQTLGRGTSSGGRRPVLLGFCDDAFCIIGIELGARHISVALCNLRGEVRAFERLSHPVRNDPQGTLKVLHRSIKKILDHPFAEHPRARDCLLGIGVAVPSPIAPDRADYMSPFIVPKWKDIALGRLLEEKYGVPVALENDANLGAVAEKWWGNHASDDDNLTYIKIGTGIGSGHIIGGQLYRGAGGSAGEIGHIVVDSNGPVCICGNRGCLVKFIGSEVLLPRARERLGIGEKEPFTAADLVDRALDGDVAAQAIIDEVAYHLGIAMAGLVNLLNPASVVLGGDITRAGERLIEPLRAAIRFRALSTSIASTHLSVSSLGERTVALGAATMILARCLREPTYFAHSAAG